MCSPAQTSLSSEWFTRVALSYCTTFLRRSPGKRVHTHTLTLALRDAVKKTQTDGLRHTHTHTHTRTH